MNIDEAPPPPVEVTGVTLTPDEAVVPGPLGEAGPGIGARIGPADWSRWKWPLILGLMALGAAWRWLGLDFVWIWAGAVALVGGLALWAAGSRLQARREGMRHLDSRSGGQTLDWRLDAVEVRQTGPFLDSAMPWTAFQHVIDGPQAFVFVLGPYSCLVLPKRELGEAQAAGVRALIDHARDRGLIGRTAAELLPSWAELRAGA